MYTLKHNQKSPNNALLSAFIPVLSVISLMVLFFGISGIVENKSPVNMASVSTLGLSFVTYFEYHILIIMGALGFTSSLWYLGRDRRRK